MDDTSALRPFHRRKILEGIETHLRQAPFKVSRSRIKKMEQPFWCQFRLRIEDFRVYYNIDTEKKVVNILGVLMKGQEETPQEAGS